MTKYRKTEEELFQSNEKERPCLKCGRECYRLQQSDVYPGVCIYCEIQADIAKKKTVRWNFGVSPRAKHAERPLRESMPTRTRVGLM